MPKEQQNSTEIEIDDNELELNDEYEQEDYYLEDEKVKEETKNTARGITSNINLSSKGVLVGVGIVGVLIVIVLFTGKLPLPNLSFLSGAGNVAEEGKGGVASGLLDSYDEAASGGEEGVEGGESGDGTDTVSLVMRDLRDYYPNYEITRDDEKQQIVAVGKIDGQPHTMYLDFTGEFIEEIIGETSVDETGKPVEETEVTAEPSTGSDTVQVSLSEYNKYHLSKKEQKFVKPQPSDTTTSSVSTVNEKLIVEYERLPIKGTTPLIYSKVIETGEEVIFPVTLKQYARLEEKGTTVIQVTRSEGYGVKTIDQVVLVKWQD